jgi:hypothetical protein
LFISNAKQMIRLCFIWYFLKFLYYMKMFN